MILTLTLLSTLVAYASAHATFQDFWINGVDQGANCVRLPASNNPVTDVSSNDLTCNIAAATAPNTCNVMPGDTVSVEMHQQPGDRSCANEAIGGAHYGPINIYMAKVSSAATAVGSSASWFKINEMGLLSSNPDYWATEVLNDNCGRYDFKIPTGIAPGQYLLRAEVIALHVASSVGGAQFYMSCFQLNVGGSGTANPAAVKIPGAYSANDPGILINIYQQLNTYVIPGPTVYNQASPAVAATAWPTTATWNTKSMPSTVPPITSAAPTSAPTSSPSGGGGSSTSRTTTTASSPSSTPTQPSGPTSPQYGQCGGIGWTGPTACAAPYKCVVTNAYYSQCV